MWLIKTDDTIIYSPTITERVVINPSLEVEVNTASKLTFTLPPSNPCYNSLNKLKTIIYVYNDNVELFRGRILSDERDFYNRKKIVCEGELRFLLDSVRKPYSWTGSITGLLQKYITEHNSQVEDAKKFTVGAVTVTDSNNTIVRSNESYTDTLSEINDKLIGNDGLGGYIVTRGTNNTRYIDYLSEYGRTSEQVIEFGNNLLDITEYIEADEVYTIILPLGSEGLTIASVNNNSDILESSQGIDLFGRITKVVEWSDVTVASNLKTKAQATLNNAIKMSVTLSVSAVDLHLLDIDTDDIRLGDLVRVVSVPHGIDDYFLCSKIDYDLMQPANTKYTLGKTRSTLTSSSAKTSNAVLRR